MVAEFKRKQVNRLGKTHNVVILSEAKNPSLFYSLYLDRREILRFAQNDRTSPFFGTPFSLFGCDIVHWWQSLKKTG